MSSTNILKDDCLENYPNSSLHSFNNPFLALDYKDEFSGPLVLQSYYTQGCKWSPDGESLIVATNDKRLQIFNLPPNVAQGEFSDEQWIMGGWKKDIVPSLSVKEAEYIYDYQWHTLLQSSQSQSFCFAVACRDLPVHLWDTRTGQIVCSYLYYNHLDELTAAHSINFNADKMKLICGYAKGIQMFDVERPGRVSTTVSCQGQSGIISTITPHPLLTNVFAVGSYSSSVGIYSLESNKPLAILNGHSRGVTHVQFSNDGTKLFSGTRKDDDIICWDIRNPGNVLCIMRRRPTTNQRMYFDITPDDKYLLSGTTEGDVLVWDISQSFNSDVSEVPYDYSFVAHKDSVNGISINPFYPILATSCGQRQLPILQLDDQEDSDNEDVESSQKNELLGENSMKLWWVSGRS